MQEKPFNPVSSSFFFDRDLSWISFNERVLAEAERDTVPIMERIKFMAIYSSNLDEFYRVRVPALMALKDLAQKSGRIKIKTLLTEINTKVSLQQQHFGKLMRNSILPFLKQHNVVLLYDDNFPNEVVTAVQDYFISHVATYIHVVDLSKATFFPENNKLYFAVTITSIKNENQVYIINIPSDFLPRFIQVTMGEICYIVFLDDVVRINLSVIFREYQDISCHSFKVTRNAELDLQDEFAGNLAKKIEKKIRQRDFGLATRLLFEPGIPAGTLGTLIDKFNLKGANLIAGGRYHNLKNLQELPLEDPKFHYESWPRPSFSIDSGALFDKINASDILLHTPYHHYDTVVRFFNEASIDPSVKKIYVTLYRIATNSRIANALISAAKNGKKVTVFVEFKARFDEANNIKWAKHMKAAGIRIIESLPGLKVHAKIALVKRRIQTKDNLLGLLSTGNFNENTAQYYTDHVLMTAHEPMLREVEKLFTFLKKKRKHPSENAIHFEHLLVGQFNLQPRFVDLIEREIENSRKGLPASIVIKLNNLEEKKMIAKLYEASEAGVKVSLIVRSICCLVPGVSQISDNITITRIIDRYLEHGRIFIFNNNNEPEVFLGSADWMNRNIYRRIEVCFPIYKNSLKAELIKIIDLQLLDNTQAVLLDKHCENKRIDVPATGKEIRSQRAIADLLITGH